MGIVVDGLLGIPDADFAQQLHGASHGIGLGRAALVNQRLEHLLAKAQDIASNASGIDDVSIIPALPIASPGQIICLGLNYVEHIKEGGYDIPDYPALFMRGRKSIMAAGAPMVRPSCSEKLDYEAELVVISHNKDPYRGAAYERLEETKVLDLVRMSQELPAHKNYQGIGW